MDFTGKKVLVVGAARSGISAAKLLKRLGADVILADNKSRESFGNAADEAESLGVKLLMGQNAGDDIVCQQSLIIASPGIPADIVTFEAARRFNIPIMGEMELGFANCPCPVGAITGTNGKTTTTALAGQIIAKHIKDTIIVGNIGIPFTECVMSLTADSFAVIEASSFQLEDVSIFKPKISAVLNITPDHLDRHKTMEKYIEAKTNIFKHTDKSCFVILNQDDGILNALTVGTGARVLKFSVINEVDEGAYLKNGIIVIKYGGQEFELINKDQLKILGGHNVENALAAALMAFCAGVPASVIADGLVEFNGVPHRIEFVRELNGIKYFNDSKGTNPDASIKAINAMNGKTVLIAGGYDKDADFSELAELFDGKISQLIVLGKTKEKIIKACEKTGFNKYIIAKDYEEAVSLAAKAAELNKSPNVLLSPACASWDMFRDFEERGECFKNLVNML